MTLFMQTRMQVESTIVDKISKAKQQND